VAEKYHYKFGMESAHEKTRIRQLEDAAAHWEHKYTNARQYNRNLEERNKQLEAALRKCAGELHNYHSIASDEALDAAHDALCTAAETPIAKCACSAERYGGKHSADCPRYESETSAQRGTDGG
jgi:hypothetical protein